MAGESRAGRSNAPDREARILVLLLALVATLSLGLGLARVFALEAHPPAWAGPQHFYDGFIAVDGYPWRAEAFRDWLAGDDPQGARLGPYLRESAHPSALLVPFLIGALSLAVGSISSSFILLSAACFVLQVLLAVRLAAFLVPEHPDRAGACAGLLVAGHFLSSRLAGSLVLDPFIAACATLAVLLALRLRERPDRAAAAALFAVQVLGSFIKLSYLPFLAAPALVFLLYPRAGNWGRALHGACFYGLLPALPLVAFWLLVPRLGALSGEAHVAVGSWRMTRAFLLEYALELVLIVQFLPWLLLRRSTSWTPPVRAVLAAAVPALLAVLMIQPPINPRLFLPPLVLLLVAATPALLRMFPGRKLAAALLIYSALNLGLAAAALAWIVVGG